MFQVRGPMSVITPAAVLERAVCTFNLSIHTINMMFD